MDLKIREFKLSLMNYINDTALPEEVKRLVLKEIYVEAERKADKRIKAELEAREAARKEEKDG